MNIGSIIQWGSNTIPNGWLLCDGSAVSRTTYADLFAVIGTTYGLGDGSTTFNIPDYRDRVPVGLDSNDSDFNVLGKKLGEKTHTLTIDEMPSHGNHIAGTLTTTNAVAGTGIISTENPVLQGGGQPHNIIQPSIVTNYIIKALYPETIKISELDSATNITSSDVLPIVQSGVTKKITADNLLSDVYDAIEDVYSTDEVKTNKVWIDLKPVYRKVVDIGSLPNNGRKTINLNLSNVENITDISGKADRAGDTENLKFLLAGLLYRASSDTLFVDTTTDQSAWTGTIIIEYTKTTD